MARSISQRFPSRSPTVGLTCASAIRTAAMRPAYPESRTDGYGLHLDARRVTMVRMRTTIDLPEDLHRIATAIARDTGSTLSEAVALLMRRAFEPKGQPYVTVSTRTRLPVLHLC